MKKISILILLLFSVLSGRAQDVTNNLSRHQADSLLKSLKTKIPDSTRIDILLKLAQFNILKPGSFKPDLDSATRFVDQAAGLNAKVKPFNYDGYLSLAQAYLFREKEMRNQGKVAAKKAIELLKHTSDWYHLGEAYFELAQYDDYNNPDQLTEKIRLVAAAVRAFQQSGHVEIYAYTLKYLGDLYNIKDDNFNALTSLKLSLSAYQSIHYKEVQGVYDLIGNTYYQLKDYKQALSFGLMAAKNAQLVNDTTMQLCEIYNHIGIALVELRELNEAIRYFKNAIKIAIIYKDNSAIYVLASNTVTIYTRAKKPKDALVFLNSVIRNAPIPADVAVLRAIYRAYLSIYSQLNDVKLAQSYCNKLLDLVHNNNFADRDINSIYSQITLFYISSKQFNLAKEFIDKDQLLARKIGDPNRIEFVYSARFMLDTAMGNYRSAVHNILAYNRISDSIFDETKSRQIKQLEVQYETAQKEEEIKVKDRDISILNQKSELQQDKLQKAERFRNETLAAILVLLASGGILYRQYLQKQKTNKIITDQNSDITGKNQLLQRLLKEKEWLLKEVHHRVKNNLHTVICLLESQSAYLESDALKAVENSQHRIFAMSLIHQKLYQSEDVKTIDMAVYLAELVHYLKDGFDIKGKIRFQLDVEAIPFGVGQAIPIALIVNEAVTNSIKYAFTRDNQGMIMIKMYRFADLIKLVIADDGVGIDLSIVNKPTDSLGLKLIKGLSEDLNGKIMIENDRGTCITVTFSIDPLTEKDSLLNDLFKKEVSDLI